MVENRVREILVQKYSEVIDPNKGTFAETRILSPSYGAIREQEIVFYDGQIGLIKALLGNPGCRETLTGAMHTNTPKKSLDRLVFGAELERPLSANFFLRSNGEVIVQSGEGDKVGEHAIHKHMMKTHTFIEESKNGSWLRSGHVWRIVDGDNMCQVAMFDSVEKCDVVSQNKQVFGQNLRHMMRVLTRAGYVCLTTDGYPVYPLSLYTKLAEQLEKRI